MNGMWGSGTIPSLPHPVLLQRQKGGPDPSPALPSRVPGGAGAGRDTGQEGRAASVGGDKRAVTFAGIWRGQAGEDLQGRCRRFWG